MTDNIAVLDGYTVEYMAESENGEYCFPILTKPDVDLDSTFKCWDMDSQEYIRLNGWLWTFSTSPQGGVERNMDND